MSYRRSLILVVTAARIRAGDRTLSCPAPGSGGGGDGDEGRPRAPGLPDPVLVPRLSTLITTLREVGVLRERADLGELPFGLNGKSPRSGKDLPASARATGPLGRGSRRVSDRDQAVGDGPLRGVATMGV
ncbi:hypothetical protein GCM10027452_20510 [Micromonospora halotolerans]